MARRYVRDKIGRFAAKGGGGKRAGKLSKSTAGRSAKAAYKSKSGAARKEKSRAAYMRAATEGFKSRPPSRRGVKKKRGAKTFDNTTNQMFKQRKLKRDLKRKYPGSKASKRVAAKAKRAGKQSKVTQGRAAKAKYKSAKGKLKQAEKGFGSTSPTQPLGSKGHKKKVAAAKGRLTRVTNKLTAKRAAKAKVSPKRAKAKAKAEALSQKRGSLKTYRAGKKKAAATRAKTAAKKKALAKSKSYSGLTPKQQYKAARSRVRAEKSGYMQDRGEGYNRAGKVSGKGRVKRSMKYSDYGVQYTNQSSFVGAARAQRTRVKNKLTKGSTQGKGYGISKKGKAAKAKFRELKRQRGGATKGRGTIAQRKASLNYRTTNQAFGMKNKRPVSKAAQKYIGKSNVKEMEAKASRGKGSKAKRRAANLKKKRK